MLPKMPERPRVLHVYKDFWPPIMGGAEKTINLMCHAVEGEYEPIVLVSNRAARDEESIEDGIRVFKASTYGRYLSAPLTPGLHQWIRKLSPDILHVHLPNPTAEIAVLLSRVTIPVVVTWHSDVVRQAWAMTAFRPIHHRFLNRVSKIMPTSPQYMESSVELRPFLHKCAVLPLAIRISDYELDAEEIVEVRQLQEKKTRPIVSFVGRLRYYKGLHYLLQAATKLDADFWIVGRGPEEERLKALVTELGITDKVTFLGDLTDRELKVRLHASDIYCLPSHLRAEAFGLNQIEAMACGLPVVSTNVGGVAFVNQDGESGIVVPPGDADALAEAINRLLRDDALRERLSQGARQRARNCFDIPQLRQGLLSIYREVIR